MHPVALAPCLLALLTLPDIVLPGTRNVLVETRLEAAPLLDRCCVQYVVKKGDTLEKIARQHTGNLGAVRGIQELNPGLEPSRLRIDQRLWLPPRKDLAEGEEPLFVYAERGWPVRGTGKPFAPEESIRPSRNAQLAFLLVPKSQLATYEATRVKGAASVEKLAVDHKIQLLTSWGCGSSVAERDPTHRLSETFVIERGAEGEFALRLQVVAFDKDGKVIEPKQDSKGTEPAKEGLWLLLLAAAGGGWLLLARRRSDDPSPATA